MKRKNKNILLQAAVAAAMTAYLSGCSYSGNQAGFIQQPKADNSTEEDLTQKIKSILPAGSVYLTADHSDKKQSIVLDDINQDGKQEALVLYRDTRDNKQAHFLILQEKDGNYEKIWDQETGFSSFDSFEVVDLDGDGKKEIIAGGQISGPESPKQLFIYELNQDQLVQKGNPSYETLLIRKFGNSQSPFIFLSDGKKEEEQKAELFSYEGGQLISRSSVELNPQAVPEQITAGLLADGTDAVFIDSGLGAHSMLTEILGVKDGKLIKIGDDNDTALMKEYPLYSRDLNGDGVIEAGGMYIPNGYEDAAMAEIPFIQVYYDYKLDGSKTPVEERYAEEGHHFYITIPSDLYGKITVKRLDQGVQLVTVSGGETVFEVKWVKKDNAGQHGTILGKTNDTIYYTELKDELPISRDQFHLVGEENESNTGS
ncbi:FG-GAP-like repeat-containing protein [Lacrimispora defluvii]|uniref:VCBS repeat-containing protein n=1 Tax=Lacrimispora defluvii TaxID=2719233 RepID=A0ABX1W134_9FIRM|nr:VCBS repeat-containing protein [Lacrimispora defluvii]NNJ32777.1 hypothetical protein [Lacrimispora defluvii]